MGHIVRMTTYVADCLRAATSTNGKAGAGAGDEGVGGLNKTQVLDDSANSERLRATGEAILGALNAWPEWTASPPVSASTESNAVFAGDDTKSAANASGAEPTATAAAATSADEQSEQQQPLKERWQEFVEGPLETMRNKNKIVPRVCIAL